jgi:hypothetical protein
VAAQKKIEFAIKQYIFSRLASWELFIRSFAAKLRRLLAAICVASRHDLIKKF